MSVLVAILTVSFY